MMALLLTNRMHGMVPFYRIIRRPHFDYLEIGPLDVIGYRGTIQQP